MPRKTKKEEIEALEKELDFYKNLMEEVGKRNRQLVESRDEVFSISSHRFQLEDRLSFFQKLYELETDLYDSLKQQMHRRVHALVEKQLEELSILKDAPLYPDYTQRQLKDEIMTLTSKLQNRDETIEILMGQIEDYRKKNADLEAQLELYQAGIPTDYQECIKRLQTDSSSLRKRYDALLLSYCAFLDIFSDGQLKDISRPKDVELIRQKVNQTLQKLPEQERPENVLKEATYFNKEEKAKLTGEIERLEHEISRLSIAAPVKAGRPSTISDSDIEKMRELREQKYSYRKIAEVMGCSVGTVFRLLSK